MKKRGLSLLLAILMVVAVFSPAFPFFVIEASALGTNSYEVELAFNNLFVFEEWSRNDLSTTVMSQAGPDTGGTIDIDVTNGSFRLTKTDMALPEIFTAFSMDTENASGNRPYYNMAVEPNTTYRFSYNVSGNIWAFTPYVFFYDNNGLYNSLVPYPTPGYGVNSFDFTTPANVTSVQIRWTIGDTSASRPDMDSVYADVSDIMLYKVETVYSNNLFNFDTWASSGQSHLPATSLGFGGGTVAVNSSEKSMTLTTNATGALLLTNFTMNPTATDNSAYHTIPVEANKQYTLAYSIVNENNLPSAVYCQPFIAYYKADGSFITFQNYETPAYGKNHFTFTTPAETASIQVVFSLHTSSTVSSITVKDIGVYVPTDIQFVEHTANPHRKVYTYTYNGANGQYGELPTPDYIPDGYVFSGWFTGENGTGERITPETYVKMESMSVFPYYEPKVDTLELVTAPNKTTYTVGEKLNTAGLSLKATQNYTVEVTDEEGNVTGTEDRTRTFYINSNVYCTPEYLKTAGTQTITAHYGGKTVTFPVTVLAADSTDIVFNGEVLKDVPETNGKYTFNRSVADFNQYKITYATDSYVKGIITYEGGITEEFFLEPGDNEVFVSFVDNFIYTNYNGTQTYDDDFTATTTHNHVASIEFTCLNNEYGEFQLKSVTTSLIEDIPEIEYFDNAKYRLGVDILYGGVVSELYDKSDDKVTARVYNTTFNDGQGNVTNETITLVDYASKLPTTGVLEESNMVNLINTLDRGRYLQQSYYGTNEDPYVQGSFNGAPWKYNPVQGGNVAEEASKVIYYEVTDTYIYVKARPMEWEKWSDDHVDICNHYVSTATGMELAHTEKLYGNDVVSDTYVEAWYYFDDGMIKVQNRKVDYSGLPEATTQQEMPALYVIEPLNHFVYNDVAAGNEWSNEYDEFGGFNNGSLKNIEEPEFWGIVDSYHEYHYVVRDSEGKIVSVENDKNGDKFYDLFATCNENWSAFTASDDPDSFGVGIYTPGVTEMYYGVMPQIYVSGYDKYGNVVGNSDSKQYRHAETIDPAKEMPTSYIAPLQEQTFRSFEPTEYVYYLKTGTAEEIYDGFSTINDKEAQEELAKTKIAVPETSYLNPSNNTNGQFYVNNLLDEGDYYNVTTEADSDNTNLYFGIHVKDGVSFTATVTNVTSPSNDIILGNGNGTGNREGELIRFDSGLMDSYISTKSNDGGFSLRLTNPISPGSKVTAKWDITVTLSSGATETHTVYTVLYAPGLTVGAVAEGRQVDNSQNEVSSWITGANGVDHTQKAPLGSFQGDKSASGYFKEDPLVLGYQTLPTITGSGETPNDYINVATGSGEYYVMQAATNGHDDSRSQSYLGLLTVDKSRYTNTNQIPNLRIGYDALRRGNWTKDSFHTFNTYYTLGTIDSFTSTDTSAVPTGWTEHGYYTNLAESHSIPFRETVVPEYDVSEIDGKYIHAITRAQCIQDFTLYIVRRYSTAGTSVLCSVTDKSALRDAVLEGYNKVDASEEYLEKLENAATVLGDPSASQESIDNVRKELAEADAVDYALKYDNIFSALEFSQHAPNMTVVSSRGTVAYNNGIITVTNAKLDGATEAYTNYGSTDNYYLVAVKPNTEYVFEYDVTTTEAAQAFMFFYNASGGNGDVPTNMSIKTNNGSWGAKSESNSWFGNYTRSAGTYHYVIKFTTGANTVVAGFRFGNTSSNAVTSSFSNIKLVESSKYYADVTYTATETVHKENTAYGTLQTLTRPGYTFNGWKDANGNTVTGATLATEHKSIYSVWNENSYTVKYDKNGADVGSADAKIFKYTEKFALPDNFSRDYYMFKGWAYSADATAPVFKPGQTISFADIQADKIDSNNQVTLYAVWEKGYSLYYSPNGGTGELAGTFKGYTEAHTVKENTTITRDGYIFLGWSLDQNATTPSYYAGDELTVSAIDSKYIQKDVNNELQTYVVLHAVWYDPGKINVTFDNLVDISQWSTSVGNGTLVNPTDTGFTVKSNEDAGEATCSSAYFTIEAGHKYVVEADIKGDAWDVYFFFCDANGNWVDFNDGTNRFSSNGHNVSKVDGIHYTSLEFTAPAGAVKAQLRVDANGSNNAIRYENIRVYDVTNTTYLNTVNKYVEYGEAYGELPVPVKEGSQFLGWVDEKGNTVTAESIMNSATTVYLKSTWTVNPNTANDDTVVIEYGCPVIINVLANDKGGTVSGIGTAGVRDSVLGKTSYPSSILTDRASELALEYGNVKLNADGTITFTPSDTNVSEEIVFYYELTVNGAYYYAKVTVIPATTIYFEDTFFDFTDSTVTKNGTTYNYNWQNLGESVGEVFQSADRPGAFNFHDDANNVYGYDSKSDSQVSYSGGTAHFVEVDQIAGTSAPTATFTFTGTGFDLFSVTDSKSGTVTLTIYSGTAVDASNRVMGIMSNTYFGYGYDSESDSFVTTDNGALFQVPVIRTRDLSYGTYTVVVQPRYNKAFDVANTGKSGVYVDSVRIYDPMGDGNTTANDAYKADGEYAPQYLEIRDTLVASNKDGSFTVSDLGIGKSVFLDGGKSSMDDFANLGPKNEVYLQNGNSVAFHIVTDRADLPSTIQLGMKLTGKGGSTATVNLMNAAYNGWSENFILNSTEERYYNVEAVIDWVEQPDGTYKTASPVIVTNTSDAIISLTSIKWAFDSEDNAVTALNLMSDMDTPVLAKAAIMRMADPQVNPQQTILSKDNIGYEFTGEPYAPGDSGTLIITTEQGVSGVTVNGTDVLDCVTNEDGKLEWTFEFTAESADSMTFEIIACDENGIMSEAIYASIAIEDEIAGDSGNDATEPDDDTTDDTTEPDDEITDDTTVDSGLGSLIGADSFVTTIINNILAILEKILGLFFGGVTA